jgi:predicted DCC family thiol-disulfide oxidoreductase YuxK
MQRWVLVLIFLVVPYFIRDFMYDRFAAIRIRLFGEQPSICKRMTSKLAKRFIDHEVSAVQLLQSHPTHV